MASENRERRAFDPLRDILMAVPGRTVGLVLYIVMALGFCAFLLYGMGWANNQPLVAVIGGVCAAVLLLTTLASLRDQPVIILLSAALMFCLAICAHLGLMEIAPGRMTLLLSPLMEDMWNYDLLTAMAWEDKAWSGGYLIVLGLLSRLESFPWLYAVKLVNLVFIAAGAACVQRLYLLNGGKPFGAVLASGISMLAITVLMNSGAWTHCDAIYAALSLWGLYLLLAGHPWGGCVLWGLAVGFKLQAAFLFPLLIPMFMERKISLRHLLGIAAGFLALHIPMFLDGQSFMSILGRYNTQITEVAYEGAGLTDNAPGVYGLMVVASVREFSGMGLFFSLFMALLLSMAMVRRGPLTTNQWMRCALLLAFGLPMILPQMNVRALYLALLIALAGARDIRGILAAALVEIISLFGYMKGIFGHDVVPLLVTSLVALVFTFYMITDCLAVQGELRHAES